jgi:hypothetical protein
MSFTIVSAPNVGDPTRQDTFAVPVIDDLNFLNGVLQIAKGSGIINGSFELDTPPNSDLAPIEWTLNLSSGNTCKIENTSSNVHHGGQAFSMTNPGGVSGGVSITSSDYYTIGEEDRVAFYWWMFSTVATTTNTVYVNWFDYSGTALSTTTLYNFSSGNPTSWQHFSFSVQAPTGARYFNLEFVGVNSTTAGTTYWDGISYEVLADPNYVVFNSVGAINYIPSRGVTKAKIILVGGGCGGNSAAGGNTSISGGTLVARGGPTTSSGQLVPQFAGTGGGAGWIQFGSSGATNTLFNVASQSTGASNGGGYAGEVSIGYIYVNEGVAVSGTIGAGGIGSSIGYNGLIIIEEMIG